jgi:3',5'-cyclic AMP phosphodiesterase CpdA
MALQQLGLPSRYYSYDQAGWHFIILDSTHPRILQDSNIPYTGKLDEEQYLWLVSDLKATPAETPVCIASHIPILAACEYGAWMHIDARRMRSLFLKHRNVRLCLSGHGHQHDRVEYLGVKYLCDGAVSGNWWSGDYMDFPPAYVVVDLYSDGSSDHRLIAYDEA